MSPHFSRSVTNVGDSHIVALRGELDVATAEGLFDWLTEVSGSTVVVDLSELTFMDSSGISVMIQAKNAFGDSFVITRPRPNIRRVFEITGLSDWLTDWDPEWLPATQYVDGEGAPLDEPPSS